MTREGYRDDVRTPDDITTLSSRPEWRDLMRFLDKLEMTRAPDYKEDGIMALSPRGLCSLYQSASLFWISTTFSVASPGKNDGAARTERCLHQLCRVATEEEHRSMACSTSENVSKYTSLWQLYFCVKPGINPDLCSAKRLSRLFVTPMYSVVSFLLVRMYV